VEVSIEFRSPDEALAVFGSQDRHLRMLRERYDVTIVARNGTLKLVGEDQPALDAASEVVRRILHKVRSREDVTPEVIQQLMGGAKGVGGAAAGLEPIKIGGHIEGYRARSPGQQKYLELIDKNEIVFGIGPAGTGKTFLAVLKAVEKLKAGEVVKLVLCRPAVEAGERLGFLPGDFQAKVNPYLRPLYDALNEILDVDTVKKLIERETIEVVPLAYMRGRTLNKSFIILDEAQNTSREQMKMFLTRMGEGSRIVVTGDITQIDLPEGKVSGLVHIQRILKPSPGIAFHHMGGADIVRHRLVWHVIQSYERAEKDEGLGGHSHHGAGPGPSAGHHGKGPGGT
jgi:phosphate starvation-inducible protein PhoH and related proteins